MILMDLLKFLALSRAILKLIEFFSFKYLFWSSHQPIMIIKFKVLYNMPAVKAVNKLIDIVCTSKTIQITENINIIRLIFAKFLRSIRSEYCIKFLVPTVIDIIIKIFRKSKNLQELINKLRTIRYLENNNKYVDNMILCSHLNTLISDLKNIYENGESLQQSLQQEVINPNLEFFERVRLIDIWD